MSYSKAEPRLTKIVKRTDNTMQYNGEEIAAQRPEKSQITISGKDVVANCGQNRRNRKTVEKKQARTEDFFRRNTATIVEELYKKRKANRGLHMNNRKCPIADSIPEGAPSMPTEYSQKKNLQECLPQKKPVDGRRISETKRFSSKQIEMMGSKFKPYKTLNFATMQQQKNDHKTCAPLRSSSAPIPIVRKELARIGGDQTCATKQRYETLSKSLAKERHLNNVSVSHPAPKPNETASQFNVSLNENNRKTNKTESAVVKSKSMRERMNELRKQWLNDVSTSSHQFSNALSQPHDNLICTSANDEYYKNLHSKLENAAGFLNEKKTETTKMVRVDLEKPSSSKQVATSSLQKDKSNQTKLQSIGVQRSESFECRKAERRDNACGKQVGRSKESAINSTMDCLKEEEKLRDDAAMHKFEILKSADSALTEYSERLKSMLTTFERSYESSCKDDMGEQSYTKSSTGSMETATSFLSEFEYRQTELSNNNNETWRTASEFDSSYSSTENEPLWKRNFENERGTDALTAYGSPGCNKELENTRTMDGLFPVRKIYLPLHQPFFTLFLSSRSPGRMEATKSKDLLFN